MMNQPMMLSTLLMLLAGCEWLGPTAAKFVPALEVVDPSLAVPPLNCDEEIRTPLPGRNGVIDTLTCGSVVEGYSGVGTRNWGDKFYRAHYCTPEAHFYDNSPEAVYSLEVPPNLRARIRLDSNCENLDVVAVAWESRQNMPNEKHSIIECEMDTSRGGGNIAVATVDRAQRYLLGVDGQNGAVGNFRLTVVCEYYR